MPEPLSVDRYLGEIVELVRRERRAVIVAPPGAGKTTRIRPALTGLGRTILLQPRRIAARALARRIGAEQGWEIGAEVGWQVRFERRFGPKTKLLVATEGILTARLQADPLLSDFSVIILDEFHERSLHADLALALAKEAAASRGDLAIVVMSATIDAAPVSRYLDGARVIDIEARQFPIEMRYSPGVTMAQAVREIAPTARGHVLCFLPGAREIEAARTELAMPDVLPLHGSLDVEAQERALAPSEKQKIILATNVAETSLTVEGVSDVIDSGLQKLLRFDPETAVDHLRLEPISRDSADQRSGRAGRTGPGRATRLWDSRQILSPAREAEVRRVDLASPVLDVIAWGGDPRTFNWFERPPDSRIEGALGLLRRLGAVEGEPHPRLTRLGEMLRRFPLHPRLARVLVDARGSELAIRICALLSEGTRGRGTGDALALADDRRLDAPSRELATVVRNVLGAEQKRSVGDETLRRALLSGYPDRVAMRREAGSPRLLLASGTGAVLPRGTELISGEFLVALDVAGQDGESLVRVAAVIEREWLEPTRREVVHSMRGDRVRAVQNLWYDELLLREISVEPDPGEVHRLLASRMREAIDRGLLRRLFFARIEVDWDAVIAATGSTHLPFDVQRKLDALAPERLPLPSGRTVALDYREDRSVVASAKLQELFGLAESPTVGPERTPVTFALLAPNGRPVQITSDLRSFWNGAYQEVRKELRGRYPKHPWPEDPWTAVATHRAKKRL